MRHALARQMLCCGANLPEISRVLRHQDLSTTAVYVRVEHRHAAARRRRMAGDGGMWSLCGQFAITWQMRRALGHQLDDAGPLLPGSWRSWTSGT
jgi:hypothetical protein